MPSLRFGFPNAHENVSGKVGPEAKIFARAHHFLEAQPRYVKGLHEPATHVGEGAVALAGRKFKYGYGNKRHDGRVSINSTI